MISKEERWTLRLEDAWSAIVEAMKSGPAAYSDHALETFLSAHRSQWRLPMALPVEFFAETAVRAAVLRKRELTLRTEKPTSYPKHRVLYARATTTEFELGLSLRANSYLSHLSAAVVHDLTELLPQTIIVNCEQAAKTARPQQELTQERINAAFARPTRKTKYVYSEDSYEYILLSSQHTDKETIVPVEYRDGHTYQTTSLERTLIDCIVRPVYSGGVFEVLRICEAAKDQISINTMLALLRQLPYLYPYHQSIGFFLERAGYPTKRLERLKKLGQQFDFYADYEMEKPAYSEPWRLYYPREFDV